MAIFDLYAPEFPHGSPQGYEDGCRGQAECTNFGSTDLLTCKEAHIARQSDYTLSKKPMNEPLPRAVPPAAKSQAIANTKRASRYLGADVDRPTAAAPTAALPAEPVPAPAPVPSPATVAAVAPRNTLHRDIVHGTPAGYQRGCRTGDDCPGNDAGLTCAEARRQYQRDYKAKKAEVLDELRPQTKATDEGEVLVLDQTPTLIAGIWADPNPETGTPTEEPTDSGPHWAPLGYARFADPAFRQRFNLDATTDPHEAAPPLSPTPQAAIAELERSLAGSRELLRNALERLRTATQARKADQALITTQALHIAELEKSNRPLTRQTSLFAAESPAKPSTDPNPTTPAERPAPALAGLPAGSGGGIRLTFDPAPHGGIGLLVEGVGSGEQAELSLRIAVGQSPAGSLGETTISIATR